ncbi:MAG: hypothetical protein HY271_07705 [Deltaproteobacteria bacterium]|nr:hypothetical protein [Deltaproteobacteria bacterium]
MMQPEDSPARAERPPNPLEILLKALLGSGEVHVVIKNGTATAELRGRARLRRSVEWLTIEFDDGPSHAHLRRGGLAKAEFLTGSAKNRGVRFLDAGLDPAITCYVPATCRAREPFSAERLAKFDKLEVANRNASWRQEPPVS